MTKPFVKGWCPGAHRPMASGDGLLVRIRPKLGQLTKNQIEKICKLSSQYGSGIIEFTSRANLQLRGVNETRHPEILNALAELDLLDPDSATNVPPPNLSKLSNALLELTSSFASVDVTIPGCAVG